MATQRGNFDSWRLSRITEEVDSVSVSSSNDDGTSTPRSVRSQNNTLERNMSRVRAEQREQCSSSGYSTPHSDGIYSKATIGANPSKDSPVDGATTPTTEENRNKDALRFIKEKYDSLGKVKIQKPQISSTSETVVFSSSDAVNFTNNEQHFVLSGHQGYPQSSIGSPLSPLSGGHRIQQVGSINSTTSEQSYVSPFSSGSLQYYSASQASSILAHKSPQDTYQKSEANGRLNIPQNKPGDVSRDASPSPRVPPVAPEELLQVEMFYSSHKTSVSVCPCLATLYVGTTKSIRDHPTPHTSHPHHHHPHNAPPTSKHEWVHVKSGLPVLILDSGESRRKRRLCVVLAERGTGFCLWRDVIDHLSEYAARSAIFHTMFLSDDHSRVAGLRFDDPAGAAEFAKHLRRLAADSDGSALNVGEAKKAAKKSASKERKGKGKALSKAAISQPCCFTHITKLDGSERRLENRNRNEGTNAGYKTY